MLQPKRTKFRRVQKGRSRGLSHRGSTISFGSFALKCLEPGWITSRQIEASRIAVTRYMKREGKVWIRIFQTNQLHLSRHKYEWEKVKELQVIGLLLSNLDV